MRLNDYTSADHFINSGQEILGSPTAFAAALQNAGKYGINRDGSKVKNFVSSTASTILGLAGLIADCFK